MRLERVSGETHVCEANMAVGSLSLTSHPSAVEPDIQQVFNC